MSHFWGMAQCVAQLVTIPSPRREQHRQHMPMLGRKATLFSCHSSQNTSPTGMVLLSEKTHTRNHLSISPVSKRPFMKGSERLYHFTAIPRRHPGLAQCAE